MSKDADVQLLQQAGLNIGYLALNTKSRPSTRSRCARRLPWRSTATPILKEVYQGAV